jgi:hypothetical protein
MGRSFDRFLYAEVAQLVERNLAKVEVAGSSLVFRSNSICKSFDFVRWNFLFLPDSKANFAQSSRLADLLAGPGGGTGRRAGLKILFAERRVRVRFPSGAQRPLSFAERFLHSGAGEA